MINDALNGAEGISDIEGSEPDWHLMTRVGASECGQRASFNGADSISHGGVAVGETTRAFP
jgi:hypothetical protein